MTLHGIRVSNPKWFSNENKRFFGDLDYSLVRAGSGTYYLCSKTYGWSDVFNRSSRRVFYALHEIDADLRISGLVYREFRIGNTDSRTFEFRDMSAIDEWLEVN